MRHALLSAALLALPAAASAAPRPELAVTEVKSVQGVAKGTATILSDIAGERVDCLGGWCDTPTATTSGTCRAIKAAGAACTSDEECASDGFLTPARCVGGSGGSVCTRLCR